MHKSKKLIIVGNKDFAAIAYEYFTFDSDYDVVAFAVERDFLAQETFCGLPVVALEDLQAHYAPSDHEVHVAVVYGNLNRVREKLIHQVKAKGYDLASYISSQAFVWRNVSLGEHCFIFEDNTLQPFVTIGNNVVIWSGNHIGHHSTIADNVFLSSHVVVSGWCTIGANSFLGVNATLADNLTIGQYCWVGHGSVLSESVPDGSLVTGEKSKIKALDEQRLQKKLASTSS